MAEYKGSSSEGARALHLEKERKNMLDQMQRQKEQIAKDKTVRVGSDKFVAQHDWVDSELKRQTVGLVRLEDFQRIRSTLEEQKRIVDSDADAAAAKAARARAAKNKQKRAKDKGLLSFDLDGDGVDEQDDAGVADSKDVAAASTKPGDDVDRPVIKKFKKNPDVDTSFLPDKDREAFERLERAKLEQQWLKQQEIIKNDRIHITYSYWDGSGHRKTVECKKGDTIRQFLEKCRLQWPQLRNVNVDNLMYIKEDLIIPSHYSFYDFIINKSRGKSGPLFSFDVHDDIRLVNDATLETEDSHAGKIMERAWYENNKHIFPANRWEIFDPQKDYGKYSIKDGNQG